MKTTSERHGRGYQGIDFAPCEIYERKANVEYLSTVERNGAMRGHDVLVYESASHFSGPMVDIMLATEVGREGYGTRLLWKLSGYALCRDLRHVRENIVFRSIDIGIEGTIREPRSWLDVKERCAHLLRMDNIVYYSEKVVYTILWHVRRRDLAFSERFFDYFSDWSKEITCDLDSKITFSDYVKLEQEVPKEH